VQNVYLLEHATWHMVMVKGKCKMFVC